MATTDSVSVFAEGTFEDQVQELVNYIVRPLSDEERTAAIRPFQDALATADNQRSFSEDPSRRAAVFKNVLKEIKGLGDGSEKEIEGFFNLVFAHVLSLYSSDASLLRSTVLDLVQTISSAPSSHMAVKYKLLSNLFNALPRSSPLRYSVYRFILDTAIQNDTISLLQLSKSDVEKWLKEWEISAEEKADFLSILASAFEKSDPTLSYHYKSLHVRSLPPSSNATSAAAADLIVTALRLPTLFSFDELFKLNAVVALKDHELVTLLRLFVNDGLPEFNAWSSSNSGLFDKYGLEKAQLERKIRLLTFASLGFKNVGQNLSYSTIAEALEVDVADVEKWTIDVIRSGLLTGKLSQTSQTLHVTRSASRTFEREQWEALEKRILVWKTGLAGVLEVVATAKRQGGATQPSIPAQVATA